MSGGRAMRRIVLTSLLIMLVAAGVAWHLIGDRAQVTGIAAGWVVAAVNLALLGVMVGRLLRGSEENATQWGLAGLFFIKYLVLLATLWYLIAVVKINMAGLAIGITTVFLAIVAEVFH